MGYGIPLRPESFSKSPQWKRGPTGYKQLCNTCGLKWKQKINHLIDLGQLKPTKLIVFKEIITPESFKNKLEKPFFFSYCPSPNWLQK